MAKVLTMLMRPRLLRSTAVLLLVIGLVGITAAHAEATFSANTAGTDDFLATGLVSEAQARRLVIYRSSFGPFDSTDWVLLVPGIDTGVAETLSQLDRLPRFGRSDQASATGDVCSNLETNLNAVLDKVAKDDPELASLFGHSPPTMRIISETLKDLTPPGTRVLEYEIDGDEITVWVITSEKARGYQWTIPEPGLRPLLGQFELSVSQKSLMGQTRSQLQKLYSVLIEPIASELGPKDSLIYISSDGPLHYVPFHALVDPDGKYLAERYVFAYVPTAATLEYALVKGTRVSSKFLGLGVNELPGWRPLTSAEPEVQTVSKNFSAPQTFLGAEATKHRATASPGVGGVLHYATHAKLEPSSPAQSAIYFRADDGSDGALRLEEIAELDFKRSSLAVLSACETNKAAPDPTGKEIIALSRSFLYAGAATVLASQWQVPDAPTYYLMDRFYRRLASGMSKAQALNHAQRDIIGSEYDHPFNWAAFQLIGDYR